MGVTGIVAPMPFCDATRTARRSSLGRLLALGALAGLIAGSAGCRREPAPAPASAAPAAAAVPDPLVTIAASVEPAVAAPGGRVTVFWRLRPAEGWHLYWPGRNDSGFAPRQTLELPAGWQAGPLQWPAPERHLSAGDILDHVYEGELVLLQELTAPAGGGAGGGQRLRAAWEWLACRDSCVPGRDSLAVDLAVAPGAAAAAVSPALAAAQARLPRPLPAGIVNVAWDGPVLHVDPLPEAAATGLVFMPDADCGELADLLREGEGPRLALRLLPADGRLGPVKGLLLVRDASGGARAFSLYVPAVPWSGTNPGTGS